MCISKDEFIKKYDMCIASEEDGFFIDLRYCRQDNFVGEVLYDTEDCLMRRGTFNKLCIARDILKEKGYYIKIWDAYRPMTIQEKMFQIVNDERYVANPKKNKSNHCKGSALDVTLCDKNGNDILMPTEFDHFGIESSRRYYENLDNLIKENVLLLENVMIEVGFIPFETEWWHFNDSDEYDVIYEQYK